MARPLPPLNWFRAFECAARHLSFTGAAEELNLTQSAVSQNVRALETRLGKVLFQRKARGLALTDAGRQLLPYVSGALSDLSQGTAIFDPLRSDEVLTIACSTSFSLLWLAPRLAAFRQAEPSLDIRITSTLWPDDYLHSQADVQIRFGSEELVGEGALRLVKDSVGPFCAPGLAEDPMTWSKLSAGPLIQTVGTSDTWQTWARDAGLAPPPGIALSVDSFGMALALAQSGVGVALGSRFLGMALVRKGLLAIPLVDAAPAIDTYFIALREGFPKNHFAQIFRDWIFAEIEAEG